MKMAEGMPKGRQLRLLLHRQALQRDKLLALCGSGKFQKTI